MPSSKGKPTHPKLRKEAKEEVQKSSKGGAPGQWTANKAARMSKVYEEKGGDYIRDDNSKNEPDKGPPEPKDKGEKQDKPGQGKRKNRGDEEAQAEKEKAQQEDDEEDQPKKKSIKKSPSKEAEPSARVTRSQDAKVQDARSSKGSQATNGTKPGNGKRKNKKT